MSELGSQISQHTFGTDVVWMTHDSDVWVQSFQSTLCVMRAHGHGLGDLYTSLVLADECNRPTNFFVDYDMDLHSLFRLALQDPIQPPFREVGRRSTEE